MFTIADLKLYAVNATSFGVCCLDEVANWLKIILLVVTIGYTLYKWYKKSRDKDE